jgi:hypothetical protein
MGNKRMTRRRFGKATLSGALAAAALSGGRIASAQVCCRQAGWRWCSKCQGLFYGPFSGSICPAGGNHVNVGSYDYELRHNNFQLAEPTGTQQGWRWCSKCQGLSYGPQQGGSICPAGGTHVSTNSFNYVLDIGGDGTVPPPGVQGGWRWCSKCRGLFYGLGAPSAGVCPAGGPHVNERSFRYFLYHV